MAYYLIIFLLLGIGFFILRLILKKTLLYFGRRTTFSPKTLKKMVDEIVNGTISESDLTENNIAALLSWKKEIYDLIDTGKLKTVLSINEYIDKTADSIFE